MQNPFENIVEVFSDLKNKNLRFNFTPWRKDTETISTFTPVTTHDDSFVELHMEVAKKVDTLIANMEEKQPENQDYTLENLKTTLKT